MAALGLAGGLAAAEVAVWRDARTPGTASLEARSPRRYVPRGPLAAGVASLVGLLAILAWCLARQVDDPAEPAFGRALERTLAGVTSTRGPFPGQYYSTPLVVVVAGALAMACVVAALALARPRNGADPAVVRVDEVVRFRGVEGAVAAGVLAVAGSLFVVATMLAAVLALEWVWASVLFLVVLLAALALVGWAVAALTVPGAPDRAVEDPA